MYMLEKQLKEKRKELIYKQNVVNEYLDLECQKMKNPVYKKEIFEAHHCSIEKIYDKVKKYSDNFSKAGKVFNESFLRAENKYGKQL